MKVEEIIKVLDLVKEMLTKQSKILTTEETLVPAEIAEWGVNFHLRNVFGDNTQFMLQDNKCLNIINSNLWGDSPTVKLITVTKLSDIRPGDLVRHTDEDNWEGYNKEKDWSLELVDRVEVDRIYTTFWEENTKLPNNHCQYFEHWKHWQVSRPMVEQ